MAIPQHLIAAMDQLSSDPKLKQSTGAPKPSQQQKPLSLKEQRVNAAQGRLMQAMNAISDAMDELRDLTSELSDEQCLVCGLGGDEYAALASHNGARLIWVPETVGNHVSQRYQGQS